MQTDVMSPVKSLSNVVPDPYVDEDLMSLRVLRYTCSIHSKWMSLRRTKHLDVVVGRAYNLIIVCASLRKTRISAWGSAVEISNQNTNRKEKNVVVFIGGTRGLFTEVVISTVSRNADRLAPLRLSRLEKFLGFIT